MEDNKELNLDVLKNSLSEDLFGLLDGNTTEIDSIEDLEKETETQSSGEEDQAEKSEIGGIEIIKEDSSEEESDKTPSSPEPSTDILLKTFGQNLSEKGLLSFNEEDFNKAEDKENYLYSAYENAVKAGIEEGVKSFKSELPEEIEKLVELHKAGVPLHKVLESDARISAFEEIKVADIEDDISLQKDILTELLTIQGFTKEKINAKLQRFEDLGSMKEEALEGLDVLISLEKAEKQQIIKAEKEKHQQLENKRIEELKKIEDTINTSEEIIPGFKLSPEDKKTLITGITKAAGVDKQGRPINALAKARIDDPKMDLKVAYFTLVLKGDISKLEKKAATKVTKSLKEIVSTREPLLSGNQGNNDSKTAAIDKSVIKNALKFLKRTS